MTRVFRLFALLAAFFVVAVRCLGGFPLAMACVSASTDTAVDAPVTGVCPADEAPPDDTMAPVAAFDSEDDGAEPALAPPAVEISLLTFAEPVDAGAAAAAYQRALPSHAQSLERPPRS